MPSTKPPSGMRDYLPETLAKRRYVVKKIEDAFGRHGFLPLETPAIENLSTLLGKYGEEGDQLLFRLLHRGDKLDRALETDQPKAGDLAELGLRYDLTVPLARVVAQYGGHLPRVFKRYQIQPVWRADRPAKGRFREFYQCDVDMTGTTSLVAEAEVMNAVTTALLDLGFSRFSIELNHRGLLRSIIQSANIDLNLEGSALTALDKLDKIGTAGVHSELTQRGFLPESAEQLLAMTEVDKQRGNKDILRHIEAELNQPEAQEAIDDLDKLLSLTSETPCGPYVHIAPSLARGLTYYTGPIFEIVSQDFSGSLGGGGRYNRLIGMFSGQDVAAVGFSLGLERILLLMDEKDMYPDLHLSPDLLICALPDTTLPPVLALASRLREIGIIVDVYPEQTKLKKQLSIANAQNIQNVLIVGSDEIEKKRYTLKNLSTGDQVVLDEDALIRTLSN